MREQLGESTSVWVESARVPPTARLDADTHADVCVVGAGIAGLMTAYHLVKAGKNVVVLNDGPLVNGQTQRTTAHLASAIDDRFTEIERVHGKDGARLAHQSHAAAIDDIERVAAAEGIDCEFARVDGWLVRSPTDKPELIDREFEAAARAGCDVSRHDRPPALGWDDGPCLRFARQGQFDPVKFLAGVAEAVRKGGGRLYGNARADRFTAGKRAGVHTSGGPTVTADAVVVTTNSPVNDVLAVHTKQAPYLTYALGFAVPAGSVPKALFWDTQDPYHYIRLQHGSSSGSDVLIVGGEDHKTGQAHDEQERFRRLEEWARRHFPSAGAVTHRWVGQVMETLDGLGFIGKNPGDAGNVYIATGDSGMGMTHGAIAGVLLTDLILGRENPWAALYDPARKQLSTLGEFVQENVNVAAQYTDWVTGGDVASADAIPAGGGAVLRRGLTKVAAHRDADGTLHECSAVCPHLGCIVHWNDFDKTWDCPCHGSRFDSRGHVINGPAVSDLTPLGVERVGAK